MKIVPLAARTVVVDFHDTLFNHTAALQAAAAIWLPGQPDADLTEHAHKWKLYVREAVQQHLAGHLASQRIGQYLVCRVYPELRHSPDAHIDAIYKLLAASYRPVCSAADGAHSLLTALEHSKLTFWIRSADTTDRTRPMVERLGLSHWLPRLVCANNVPRGGYAEPTLEHFGQAVGATPKQVVFISHDVESVRQAQAIGWTTILLAPTGAPPAYYSGQFVSSLTQLLAKQELDLTAAEPRGQRAPVQAPNQPVG